MPEMLNMSPWELERQAAWDEALEAAAYRRNDPRIFLSYNEQGLPIAPALIDGRPNFLNLDTEEAIQREVLDPVRQRWAAPSMRTTDENWRILEGNDGSVLAINPRTLNVQELRPGIPPSVKVDDPPLNWPTGQDMMGRDETIRGRPSQFSRIFDQLPPFGRTNLNTQLQMQMYGLDPKTGAVLGQTNRMQAPPPQGSDELVSVINPSGRPVRIRRSQLADALRQGYKQR